MTSAPPSDAALSGPLCLSQYLCALSTIQHRIFSSCSSVARTSGPTAPWRILWLVLVMRNTSGLGLGTNLLGQHRQLPNGGYSPLNLNTLSSQEPQQCMPHQCDTTTLRSGTEEHNPRISIFDRFDMFLRSSPRWSPDRMMVGFRVREMNLPIKIDMNFVAKVNDNARLLGRAVCTRPISNARTGRDWHTSNTSWQLNRQVHQHRDNYLERNRSGIQLV